MPWLPTSAFMLASGALLLAVLIPATRIDRRERRIPNAVTGPGAIGAIGLGLALDPVGQPTRLLAAAMAVGFLLLIRAPRPDALGLGDVKLAGLLGLALGPPVAVALLTAFAAGSAVAVGIALRGGWGRMRTATLAFGPYLALGAAVAWLAGERLLAAYLGLIG